MASLILVFIGGLLVGYCVRGLQESWRRMKQGKVEHYE
jgi:hypothetical protein